MVSEETAFLAQIEAASRLREDYLKLVRLLNSMRALRKMKKNEISSRLVVGTVYACPGFKLDNVTTYNRAISITKSIFLIPEILMHLGCQQTTV